MIRCPARRRLTVIPAALAVCSALAAGCGSGSPGPAVTSYYGTAAHPFSASSPWNSPLARTGAQGVVADDGPAAIGAAATAVNADAYSVTVYRARASDPLVTVAPHGAPPLHIRIPADARPATGVDAEMAVIAPGGRTEDECWHMVRTGVRSWTCGYHVRLALDGSGVTAGVRASGMSVLGGLISDGDLSGGVIPHALALALPGSLLAHGPVPPATTEDHDPPVPYTGRIPMGSRLALPADLDLDTLGLTPVGRELATALQRFGAYVVDEADSATLYAQPSLGTDPVIALRAAFARLAPLLETVGSGVARPGN